MWKISIAQIVNDVIWDRFLLSKKMTCWSKSFAAFSITKVKGSGGDKFKVLSAHE